MSSTMAELREIVAGCRWSMTLAGGVPQEIRFSLEPIGDTFLITDGATDRETSWDFQLTPTGVVLTVWGQHGGPTFFAHWNGERFQGRWIDFQHLTVDIVPDRRITLDFNGLHEHRTRAMEPFYVGIPTLCCYDLCHLAVDAVLRSTVMPEAVFVIDNGSSGTRFSYPHPLVNVIRAGRNLGVARSWNLLHRLAAPKPLVLLNDDISIGANCLEKLVGCDAVIATLDQRRAYEAFMLREEAWGLVGEFDEEFYPAYHEDSDHSRRLFLKGISVVCPRNHGALQRGPSATQLRQTPDERAEFCRLYDLGRSYYLRKWGGLPQQEIYTTPFGV